MAAEPGGDAAAGEWSRADIVAARRLDQDMYPPEHSFASRLNHLIDTVHPRGREPFTNRELADAVRAQGAECTPQYIGQLRAGRHAPSLKVAAALARTYGVPIEYFSDPAVADRTDDELAVLAKLRDAGVTAVALRAAGLSDAGLQALAEVIDQIRAAEGLPAESPGPPPAGRSGS